MSQKSEWGYVSTGSEIRPLAWLQDPLVVWLWTSRHGLPLPSSTDISKGWSPRPQPEWGVTIADPIKSSQWLKPSDQIFNSHHSHFWRYRVRVSSCFCSENSVFIQLGLFPASKAHTTNQILFTDLKQTLNSLLKGSWTIESMSSEFITNK